MKPALNPHDLAHDAFDHLGHLLHELFARPVRAHVARHPPADDRKYAVDDGAERAAAREAFDAHEDEEEEKQQADQRENEVVRELGAVELDRLERLLRVDLLAHLDRAVEALEWQPAVTR